MTTQPRTARAPSSLRSGDEVVVVSGLPRSGTSMMMRMLEAGGIPPLTDRKRAADADNPNGYYEYEPVKALPHDKTWVAGARGRAVKVIYKLVYELPPDVTYAVVFMQRDIEEVIRSQETMMRRDGLDPDRIGRDVLLRLFQTEVVSFLRWADQQRNLRLWRVDYALAVSSPGTVATELDAFLGGGLDIAAAAAVADRDLYRNRSTG